MKRHQCLRKVMSFPNMRGTERIQFKVVLVECLTAV